jgi:hypothetical protein
MKTNNKILGSSYFETLSISTLIYSVCLFLLSLISIVIHDTSKNTIVLDSSYVEEKIEEIIDISEMIVEQENDLSVYDNTSMSNLLSVDQKTKEIILVPEIITIDTIKSNNIETQLNTIDLDQTIKIGTNLTTQETNLGGVLDRLTLEIIDHATTKDLNVIWLLDASISLSKQRSYIKDRFSKIITEIYSAENSVQNVTHTVAAYGDKLKVISDNPSNNIQQLIQDISSITIDESGIENTFSAIEELCIKFKNSRNMIIIFTDEIGDDVQYLDKAIFAARRKGTSVYVVGPPAPFGISKTQFKYVDPDPKYDQKEKWVEINQGPETPFKTTLDLHSLDIDDMALDSGFGPYALSRLCLNTEGTYFSMHPNRTKNLVSKKQTEPLSSYISFFFDNNVMKNYSPDYRSLSLQQKETSTNKTKMALVKACSIPLNVPYRKSTVFSAISEGVFAEQLSQAQKLSAQLEPRINEIYNILREVESSADLLTEKRWKASYKLAMGRILATKCRIELYNLMLAEAKSGLKKEDKKTNEFILIPNSFKSSSSQLSKIYSLAIKYLKSITEEYPNTPWSEIAKAELDTPMGYKWIESYKEPQKQNMNDNNNNPNIPQDDKTKKLDYKPQRKIDKI